MRKYLIGIFIGIALTISSSVFAEDVISLIGQRIQGEFPVKINGTELEKPAIVINGTSYLPNRAIADALGMDIKFDADLGIELNKRGADEMSQQDTENITETDYKGLKAIVHNGETYFSLMSYNDKFNPYLWGFDSSTKQIYLAKTVKDSTEVLEKIISIDKNEVGNYAVFKGVSYVNVKYYSEH